MIIVRYRPKLAKTDEDTSFGFLDATRSKIIPLKTFLSAKNFNTLPANFNTICSLYFTSKLTNQDVSKIKETIPLAEQQLLAPIANVKAFRDFYAFEGHVKTARANRGVGMIPEWYEIPVFYFSNPNSFYGHDQDIPIAIGCKEFDYELEGAFIIGKAGKNIPLSEAKNHVLGLTILNDWSARDLQREEMKMNLGPAKGKDFASSLGPVIITMDELIDVENNGKFKLRMQAFVNGTQYSDGNMYDMHFTLEQIIERASRSVWLYPGDVIGTGTVGTGCILEIGKAKNLPYLKIGDTVELSIERVGTLKNKIIAPDSKYEKIEY